MSRAVPVRESRLHIDRRPTGLHRRRPWWRFLVPAWIAFVIGLGLVGMLTGEPPEDSGGAWFLVLWAGFGLALVCASLWGLLFREELVLDGEHLTQVRGVGRIARRRSYLRSGIEDLRVSPEGMSPFDPRAGLRMHGIGGGTIAFDYGDRTIRVGDVEEAEAKRVITTSLGGRAG